MFKNVFNWYKLEKSIGIAVRFCNEWTFNNYSINFSLQKGIVDKKDVLINFVKKKKWKLAQFRNSGK